MLDVVIREFRSRRQQIKDESTENNYTTASSIAKEYGYTFRGFLETATEPTYTAVLLDRVAETTYKLSDICKKLENDGYTFLDVVPTYGAGDQYKLILRKKHNGGRTAVLERPGSFQTDPIALIGRAGTNRSVLGILLNRDVPPEDVGKLISIAYDLGMEPKPKTSEQPKAKGLLADLDFLDEFVADPNKPDE